MGAQTSSMSRGSAVLVILLLSVNIFGYQPGKDCFECHDKGGNAKKEFRVCGNIYNDSLGSDYEPGATVTLIDIDGSEITLAESDSNGCIWATPGEVHSGPYLFKVNNYTSRMWHPIPEWGACNVCHIEGGNGIPGETVELKSGNKDGHPTLPITNNCQHCHYDPAPYSPVDVQTMGTLDAGKPAPYMPTQSNFSINGQSYNFNPDDHNITAVRSDVFAEGYYSIFDVILALCNKHRMAVEYEYDEEAKCNFITSLNGSSGSYWYTAQYHGGVRNEAHQIRWDEALWKPGLSVSVSKNSPPISQYKTAAARDGDGFTIIPSVKVENQTFTDVKVTPHDYLATGSKQPHLKPFKPGVITILDVLLSLQDEGKVNNVRMTYYDFIDFLRPGSYIGSYYVTRINDENHSGHTGWEYTYTHSGLSDEAIHITLDINVIHGIDKLVFFVSTVNSPAYYWENNDENYTPGDTLLDPTEISKETIQPDKQDLKAWKSNRRFCLHTPIPNPFSLFSTIHFSVFNTKEKIKLAIYDPQGRCVATLFEGMVSEPGRKTVQWKPKNVAAGQYYVKMEHGRNSQIRHVVYIKEGVVKGK